jgi:hypothetical protein
MKNQILPNRSKASQPCSKTSRLRNMFAASPCLLGMKAVSELKILARLTRPLKPQFSTGQ